MTSILLSIKPEYVEKIFNRTKKYEFRKRMPYKQVDKVIVYSTAPEQSVVGEFEVLEIIAEKPSPLWEKTKKEAGISRAKFREYFHGCKNAYAYKIGRVTLYEIPKKLNEFGIIQAPQSFVYLKNG